MRLRAVEPADAALLYEVENDTSAWYASENVAPLSAALLSRYAESASHADPFGEEQLRLIVEIESPGENGQRRGKGRRMLPVGVADLYEISARHQRAMTAIYILPAFRCKGYAARSLQLLADYAFDTLGLHTIAARIPLCNCASLRAFAAAGYTNAGMLSGWHRYGRRRYDIRLMQLTPGASSTAVDSPDQQSLK